MNANITNAIQQLSRALSALLNSPDFNPLFLPSETKTPDVETVRGRFGTEAAPANAIRGRDDVRAQFKRDFGAPAEERRSAKALIGAALYGRGFSASGLLADQEAMAALTAEVESALDATVNAILEDNDLRRRLRAHWAFLDANAKPDDEHFGGMDDAAKSFVVLPVLVYFFQFAVPNAPVSEINWDIVRETVLLQFEGLRSRTHYRYELHAFLNSPWLDADKHGLGAHDIRGTMFTVELRKVSDEDISNLFRGEFIPPVLPPGLSRANSAVSVAFSIPVLSTNDFSAQVSDDALEIARKVVDVLRVLRAEDLGIGHAAVIPTNAQTPRISGNALWYFQDSGAAFTPRRGYFSTPSIEPLSAGHAAATASLVNKYIAGINVRGFEVAVRRFRDSHERYWPGDPEALLDIGIAFEALFLGDQDTKELRHRLALRVARVLGTDLNDRKAVAKEIRQLYDLRSRIAHGETTETMRQKDAEKLRSILLRAPYLLRVAFHYYLRGGGPAGLMATEQISEWWANVELQ